MGPFDDPTHGKGHKPAIYIWGMLRGDLVIVQRSGRAIGWMTNHFNANKVRLVDGISTFSAIGIVRIELFEARAFAARLRHHGCRRILVLYADRSYVHCDDQRHYIDHEMTLGSFDLPASNPLSPPYGEIRVDCASLNATLGVLARPIRARHCSRSRSCICSSTPPAPTQRENAL